MEKAEMEQKQILVLGVGNILLRDEGVGVRIVEKLDEEYVFSPNVELMDGGTLGLKLLGPISEADHLIVVDALQNGQPPGTLYRLLGEEVKRTLASKNSLHQVDLLETLAYCEILGKCPSTVIIGIEPADISAWSTELTETIQAHVSEMALEVLKEIEKTGGWYRPRSSSTNSTPTSAVSSSPKRNPLRKKT
jgi:hydrogenase maturation protease